MDKHGIGITVGEHDLLRKTMRLFFYKYRNPLVIQKIMADGKKVDKKVEYIELADVDIPKGIKDIELYDLDTDQLYTVITSKYKKAERSESGKVLIPYSDATKIR